MRNHQDMHFTATRAWIRRAGLPVAFALAAACNSSTTAQQAGAPAQTTSASKAERYTVLERGAHPLARPESLLGRLDADRRIENLAVVFKMSPRQQADRDDLLAQLTDPSSRNYHRWLTPEQYAARFGARPADVARAAAWLRSWGFDVEAEPSRLGTRLNFAGTVAALEAAFRTEMSQYRMGSELHFAMARAPSVPTDLADVILGIHNTHDVYPRHGHHIVEPVPQAMCPSGSILCTSSGKYGIAPPDWTAIYDVNPLYTTGVGGKAITGKGVTIAIVGVSAVAQSDVTTFRTTYGLAANPINPIVVPNTGSTGTNTVDTGAGMEAVLDVEWSGAIAPDATVNYVLTGLNDANVEDAVYYAIEQNLGDVLSESWGGPEYGMTPSDADISEVYGGAANILGMTFLAAAGDAGPVTGAEMGIYGMYADIPASLPEITGVGGTGFSTTGGLTWDSTTNYATGYGSESVWNEMNNPHSVVMGQHMVGAGGGGISQVFARPSYQSGVATCSPLGTLPNIPDPSAMRQIPDVAFTAAEGVKQYGIFVECTMKGLTDCAATGGNPTVMHIGGTSASSPAFAGVVALAAQATGGRLGNINPMLYTLASAVPSAFHDITQGSNEMKCQSSDPGCPSGDLYGYPATTGYDCASGLGSVDANNLITAWATLAPTTTNLHPSASAASAGTQITLDATVDVPTSNGSALSGVVTFSFQSYLANGNPDLSWTVGTGSIAGGTTTSGATSLQAVIPAGLVRSNQAVDVVAMYGGDAHHLASTSAKSRITFSAVSLCTSPATSSVAAGGALSFTSQGGAAPVSWFIENDTTANEKTGAGGSTLDEVTGAFTAGKGQAGYVLVVALDADGAEMFSEVTVGSPSGAAPWAGDAGYITNACTGPCVPTTTCPSGYECGTASNECGGTINCGSCEGGATCTANKCGGSADAGPGDGGTHDSSVADTSTSVDSSSPADTSAPMDSSIPVDTGTTSDSGSSTKPGHDGGSSAAKDAASPEKDAAEHDARTDGGVAADNGGGCGCKIAPQPSPTSASLTWGALGFFGLAAVRRSRRRR